MVGMPYPNIRSPELQEKMTWLDKTMVRATYMSVSFSSAFIVLSSQHMSPRAAFRGFIFLELALISQTVWY